MLKLGTRQILILSLSVAAIPLGSWAGEVNTRTFMPAGSSNKVMHMRMQAMTMDNEMKDKLFGDGYVSIGAKKDGCKLNIGNRVGNSLSTKSQDIFIDGPVINYCR
ncbi:MAG: hypothetical protein ACWA5X_14030 [bacterium]